MSPVQDIHTRPDELELLLDELLELLVDELLELLVDELPEEPLEELLDELLPLELVPSPPPHAARSSVNKKIAGVAIFTLEKCFELIIRKVTCPDQSSDN